MGVRETRSKTMSVAQRVEVEVLRQRCDEHVMASKKLKAAFWAELSKHTPSTTTLDTLGVEFQRAVSLAVAAFEDVLRLTSSAPIMLRYSEFLSQVRVMTALVRFF